MITLLFSLIHKVSGLLIIFLTISFNTQAQTIYTWIDEKGISHFSHYPEKNAAASILKPGKLPPVNTAIVPFKQPPKKDRDNSAPHKKINSKRKSRKPSPICHHYKEKLKKIQTALRRGYKEPQGNHFREQRRIYTELLSQDCH